MDNVELEFTDEALDEIVRIALDRKTGARGLRAVTEMLMTDLMFEIPNKNNIEKVILTKQAILKEAEPEYIYKTEKLDGSGSNITLNNI